jgi:predicted DNA-binding ribbon-helix-helix protein
LGASGEHAGSALTRETTSSETEETNGAQAMRKRSVVIAGHRTSVSLETAFWSGLKEIAEHRGISVNRLVETIDAARGTNLSSAIRVFVLQCYKDETVKD